MEFGDITYFLTKLAKNSRPLDNIHFKFSVICVRFMYKYLTLCYIFFFFFNLTPFVFFKDISCLCHNLENKL